MKEKSSIHWFISPDLGQPKYETQSKSFMWVAGALLFESPHLLHGVCDNGKLHSGVRPRLKPMKSDIEHRLPQWHLKHGGKDLPSQI